MGETDRDDLISIIEEQDETPDIPEELPLLPVRDVVIFTDMVLPLFIGREKSIQAVEAAMAGTDKFLMLATQKNPMDEMPSPDDIYRVGTVGKILRMLKLPEGNLKVLVQGIAKANILSYIEKPKGYHVKLEVISESYPETIDIETEALMRSVREQCEKILSLRGEMSAEIDTILESLEDPGKLADLIASNLKLKTDEAQQILELADPIDRLKKISEVLSKEIHLSTVQAKIHSNVKDEISKSQRDYYLREQMRAIHKELGESDERSQEMDDYERKIKKARMPKEAKKEADKQLKRLGQMHPDSSEASIVRTYLDWLVEMPWSNFSKDLLDIKKAQKVLNDDHYGLEKVKDRILEHLSVRKLNPEMKGPILCFIGAPGVGKTSLGKSIARAMGRKFVRISLGGVRDEAEIRGHRRTYIGAMPGRIIQGLKQCGTSNPVFVMDEIDKMGSDFRGDPSAALLEALDPEQNTDFSDHYLNLSFDLSKVLFILTANQPDTIPSALYDRMEIINIPGYSEDEKLIIAEKYLIPRQIKENGLKKTDISFSRQALSAIINQYTSESGLRNLERELATLCRKVARRIAEGNRKKHMITVSSLEKYLGVPKFIPEMDQEESQVGLATGLAWTQCGGEAMYVEASLFTGKGELILTGQLGEVMQESARAALSYAKANMKQFGLRHNDLENVDVHIHVPAGAIPKDGPSAGVAMAAALISALTGAPIKNDVAMTGEITLRGRVLPIGGIKEKTLGALRAGIKTILVPEKNRKEVSEIPNHIARKIEFVFTDSMDKVIDLAFERPPKKQAAAAKKQAPKKKAVPRKTTGTRKK
ncbi:endopeptidase La [Desulfosudis oleivorans]|uniref:Lon protease n=1 Tax=Desulfosudis oleivorans (strain DSM 6200 / JCM 39069 / Hxd3) TaxID=96561 RepID=A8ZSC3_DESOH|nr:endopeptidase La [Desulfosudis oleivorans]ABW67660.1 ATP-dependent protease La [Desulfosudis oleivorans Hxd3]